MNNTDLLKENEQLKHNIEQLTHDIELAKRYYLDNIEYWHMRAVEAEDDRDRFAAKLDELGIDDVDD